MSTFTGEDHYGFAFAGLSTLRVASPQNTALTVPMHPNEWKQSGEIYLWRYKGNPKNYRGWHLHCDKAGADSLIQLFNSFHGMEPDHKRTIQLAKPLQKQLNVPNCKSNAITVDRCIVSMQQSWSIEEVEGKILFGFTEAILPSLIKGVLGIPDGKGDYSIGAKGSELWFWW